MKGPLKVDLARQLARSKDEAFALRYVIERKLTPVFVVEDFASESDRLDYVPFRGCKFSYFAPERADGGFVWIEEPGHGLTAFGFCTFVEWLDSRGERGQDHWIRALVARMHSAQKEALR